MHHVDLETLIPGVLIVLHGQRRDIGDHDVDAAQRGGALLHPGLQSRLVGDVERLAEGRDALGAQRGDGLVYLRLVPRTDGDMHPLVGENVGAAPTDALAAARDNGAQTLQPKIHGNRSG